MDQKQKTALPGGLGTSPTYAQCPPSQSPLITTRSKTGRTIMPRWFCRLIGLVFWATFSRSLCLRRLRAIIGRIWRMSSRSRSFYVKVSLTSGHGPGTDTILGISPPGPYLPARSGLSTCAWPFQGALTSGRPPRQPLKGRSAARLSPAGRSRRHWCPRAT